jgi:aminoglycoside phosphotransferase (APT) family kinase protein
MSPLSSELASLAHLLPEDRVGIVSAIQPLSMGPSGARVYAVSSTQGELVLRVGAEQEYASRWAQQLRVQRLAAASGIAPALVHVDEAARAVVSVRVPGVPLAAALANAEQRGAALASVVTQFRALHALDATGIDERDPLAHARREHAVQVARPGFPRWAVTLEPIFDAIETTLARDVRRVIGHNDPNPGNILWDGTRAWLIDWEVAGLAHPFYDLAVLAMFLQMSDEAALALLAQQEQRPINGDERESFAALRRLSAVLCGLVMAGLTHDLTVLPASAPTLAELYAELRAGRQSLADVQGRGVFALALLRLGVEQAA